MRRLLKKSLFPGRRIYFSYKGGVCLLLLFFCQKLTGQIANYVNNGSFEESFFVPPVYQLPKFWCAPDSGKPFGELITGPSSGFAYQIPRSGSNVLGHLYYCNTCPNIKRTYPRNRIKQRLNFGVTYCFTMYVSLTNQSTHGLAQVGVYFADSAVDTIKKCTVPITYLTPQVENPQNNIITDTLNWVKVSGVFTSKGVEKYLIIGNFYSDSATNKVLVNPTHLPANFSDYLIDDVSLIEVNLPAYAGIDTVISPGDSAFIGREPDFAIDPGCRWYRLPGVIPMDTISGMWVKPTATTTYVVRQELECSAEKWDTVVVHVNLTRLDELKMLNESLDVYPNPASDVLNIECKSIHINELLSVAIINNLGEIIREEDLVFENHLAAIKINTLKNGIYTMQLRSASGLANKRFVITR